MLGVDRINITHQTLITIGQIDAFKGLWQSLSQHTTSLALMSDVSHFGPAFEKMLSGLKNETITIPLLLQLHKALNNTSESLKTQDSILTIGPHELPTAAPEDVEPILSKLLAWANKTITEGTVHPLIICAVFTAVFLQIHPFTTGNQKTLHLLLNVFMLKSGYTYAPYAPLGPILNERTDDFFTALKNNQNSLENGAPDWGLWLSFFFGCLAQQADILRTRFDHKKDKITNLPALSAKIMALFEDHKRLQMKEIVRLTKGRRSTIKLRLQELVEGGYLKRHGKARSTWYALV